MVKIRCMPSSLCSQLSISRNNEGRPEGQLSNEWVDLSAHDSQKWARLLTPVAWSLDGDEAESVPLRPRLQKQRHLDHAGQARVVEVYQQGKTISAVSREFKLHRTTVAAILDRHDVAVRAHYMTKRHVDQARDFYESGSSLAEVGRRLGFDAATVATRLRARGVRIRDAHERRSTSK